MSSKKLFALIIGINGYQKCTTLSGCINDALSLSVYLAQFCRSNQLDWQPSYLFAPEHAGERDELLAKGIAFGYPTRANIIESLQNLFKVADPERGDLCLLYYSGHGSTLIAPPEFSNYEPTGRFQSLVCIDSRDEGQRDLADKELGYLIAKGLVDKAFDPDNPLKPGVQFVAIMDCCHAGNNLRSSKRKTRARMTSGKKTALKAEELLGFVRDGNEFYEPLVNEKVARNGLRHARYISLSASRDNESATESSFLEQFGDDPAHTEWKQHGVFSYGLLQALRRSKGSISYLDLMRRSELEIRCLGYHQRPLHWVFPNSADEKRSFLQAKVIEDTDAGFQVACINDDNLGKTWTINAGKIHGISQEQNPIFILNGDPNRKVTCSQVYNNYSVLDSKAFTPEDEGKNLRANLYRLAVKPMVIGFDVALPVPWRERIIQAYQRRYAKQLAYFEISEQESAEAQVWIKLVLSAKNKPLLCAVGATSSAPLFGAAESEHVLIADLNKVARWKSTLLLNNPENANFYRRHVDVEIQTMEGVAIRNQEELRLYEERDWKNTLVNPEELRLTYINDLAPIVKVKFKVSEDIPQSYYVGALYLDAQFGINSDMAPVQRLGLIGESSELRMTLSTTSNSKAILSNVFSTRFNPHYHEHGITEITDYIMVFVSSEPFNLDQFKQSPVELRTTRDVGSVFNQDIEDKIWFTIKIPIHIQRPLPAVTLSSERFTFLTRKLNTDERGTAHHALKIQTPQGFSAQVQALSLAQLRQTEVGLGGNKSADTPESQLLPNSELWQDTQSDVNPFCQGIAADPDSHLSVLDFKHWTGAIGLDTPLLITPGDALQNPFKADMQADWNHALLDQELVLPYGQFQLDNSSGFYIPLGFTDDQGIIHLSQLPQMDSLAFDPTATKGNKSVGTALRAWFQKLIWSRLSGRHDYNTLALHQKGAEPILYRSKSPRYEASKTTIRGKIGKAPKVLLLIHGIIGETEKMLPAFLEHSDLWMDFDAVLTFDYENLNTKIADSARILKAMLLECGLTPDKKLSIVAHSMGGLVARWWIEKEGGVDYVQKLIQAGTPNAGTDIELFRQKIITLLTFGINAVSRFKPYLANLSFLTGGIGAKLFQTLKEMGPESTFLQQLNHGTAPSVPYFLLAGDTSHIEAIFADDDPIWLKIWACLRDRSPYILADHLVFDHIPNDLAVRTESMKYLPWGTHSQVMEPLCDHLSYFENPQSIEYLKELIAR